MALAAELMVTAGLAEDENRARQVLTENLNNGRAAERFAKMVSELGGPNDLLQNPDKYLHHAPVLKQSLASRSGFVAAIDTRAVGLTVVALGGGRMRAADAIDADVGLADIVSLGTSVAAGDLLATVHARTEAGASAALQALQQAIIISDTAPVPSPLIGETIRT